MKELKTRKELIERLESNLKEQQDDKEPEVISEVVSNNDDLGLFVALSSLLKEV